jgi:hypothetical protein
MATTYEVKSIEVAKGDKEKGLAARYAIVVDGRRVATFETVAGGPKGKNWVVANDAASSPPMGWYDALDWARKNAAQLVGAVAPVAAAPKDPGAAAEDDEYGIEEVEVYVCDDCGEVSEDVDPAPLYECAEDGLFNRDESADGGSHKCPECNKFGSKAGTESCSQCQKGPIERETRWKHAESDDLFDSRDEALEDAGAGDEEAEESADDDAEAVTA